jgi:hypothetical protein
MCSHVLGSSSPEYKGDTFGWTDYILSTKPLYTKSLGFPNSGANPTNILKAKDASLEEVYSKYDTQEENTMFSSLQ